MIDASDFDRFVDERGYTPDEIPQAFADWLAEKTGDRVIGASTEGMVDSSHTSNTSHT